MRGGERGTCPRRSVDVNRRNSKRTRGRKREREKTQRGIILYTYIHFTVSSHPHPREVRNSCCPFTGAARFCCKYLNYELTSFVCNHGLTYMLCSHRNPTAISHKVRKTIQFETKLVFKQWLSYMLC